MGGMSEIGVGETKLESWGNEMKDWWVLFCVDGGWKWKGGEGGGSIKGTSITHESEVMHAARESEWLCLFFFLEKCGQRGGDCHLSVVVNHEEHGLNR